jgi:hypothetical protein
VKDYESWSFRDRSFLGGMALSLLWHFFWFFSIAIVVSPSKKSEKPKPRVVSLGPVIDDSIFRTLAQTKPQLSETFYRQPQDFAKVLEPEVKTIERQLPGDVVSVPFGKKAVDRMRNLLGGRKISPQDEFAWRIPIAFAEPSATIEGEIKGRAVIHKPEGFPVPLSMIKAARTQAIEFQVVVNALGEVERTRLIASSGNAEADALWGEYLNQWQFEALGLDKPPVDQEGTVKFYLHDPALETKGS